MSQYDAKIVYIMGDKDSVADVLSLLPSEKSLESTKQTAQHLYSYCDDELPNITCIWSDFSHTPWEATMSITHGPELFSVNATLNISTDKC